MKTYHIVEQYYEGNKRWKAYEWHWGTQFFGYSLSLGIEGTYTAHSADECERLLRHVLPTLNMPPQVVRVLKI